MLCAQCMTAQAVFVPRLFLAPSVGALRRLRCNNKAELQMSTAQKMCGHRYDSLFAYTTHKKVKIRDARLGMLHYSLILSIVFYIVVYQLIRQLGYLKFIAAQNTVRLKLWQPTANCDPNDASCEDSFTPSSQLHYCCSQNSSCKKEDGECGCDYSGTSFPTYECTWLSGGDAGSVHQSSISVATFTEEYFQTLDSSCFSSFPDAAPSCSKVWNISRGKKVFTADVEEFTLLLDHSVVSASGIVKTSRTMDGMLYVGTAGDTRSSSRAKDIQNQLCSSRPDAMTEAIDGSPTSTAPCFLKPEQTSRGLDYFKVGVLLQAMGVSLEEESYEGSGKQNRLDGLAANIVIEYSNSLPWYGMRNISYVYKPSEIPGSTYETNSLMWTDLKGSSRKKRKQSGILFEVRPGGTLATFNFTQLLFQLTTSITLLAMATVGVDILAQYVLQHRHFYGEALCDDDDIDFDQLRYLEEQDDKVILGELRGMNLQETGTKHRRILRLLAHGWNQAPASEDSSTTS
ncbi:unnamed protein product [Polarella glacialis]|uniref:Uncharacterized protein n=1 Tax=Polarella glacialis TaxID=89957 RepID=A0A813GWA2_POLGL|nr:unnamed protein product [Polarella glacialis]